MCQVLANGGQSPLIITVAKGERTGMIITFAHRIAPRAKNNQDRRAIFIQAGYKGNPRDGKKKSSLFLRARCFKDYIHVRPSAHSPPLMEGYAL